MIFGGACSFWFSCVHAMGVSTSPSVRRLDVFRIQGQSARCKTRKEFLDRLRGIWSRFILSAVWLLSSEYVEQWMIGGGGYVSPYD